MPAQKFDRVKETTNTQGTGPYILDGAVTGFRGFGAVYSSGTSGIRYLVTDNVSWEIAEGTFTTSPNQLSRTTILASSAGGVAINWSVGTKTVSLVQTASEILQNGGQPGSVSVGSNTTTTKIRANDVDAVEIDATDDAKLIIRAGKSPIEGSKIDLFDIDNSGYWAIDNYNSTTLRFYHSLNNGNILAFDRSTGKASILSGGNILYLSPNVDSDAHTLDQCVKGTWTPTLTRTDTPPSFTYTSRVGTYQKLGGWVSAYFKIEVNSVSSNGGGAWVVQGWPYTAVENGVCVIGTSYCLSSTRYIRSGEFSAGTTTLYLVGSSVVNTDATLLNGKLTGTVIYRVE